MRRIVLSGMFFLAAVGAANAADPLGEWRDEEGKATIRIVDCGSALWGVIASEKTPGLTDKNNPDRTKRSRTTLGMPILLNMKKVEDEKDKWEGEIYDPIRGKVFSSSIQVKSQTALRVEGCVAMVLCGGQTWTRVETSAGAPNGAGKMSAPMSAAPKTAAPSPFPAPIGPKTAAKGTVAKGGAVTGAGSSADPVTAEICALPEIAAAPK